MVRVAPDAVRVVLRHRGDRPASGRVVSRWPCAAERLPRARSRLEGALRAEYELDAMITRADNPHHSLAATLGTGGSARSSAST